MSEETVPDPAPKPAHRRTGLATVAIALAVLVLLLAGWSVWRNERIARANRSVSAHVTSRLATFEHDLAARNQQAQTGDQRLAVVESNLDGMRTDLRGLDRRIANLETAFANLTDQRTSAHDALLLDNAALLLRTGEQRYELFHDATGALKAYTLAVQTLAQVQDPAYAPVRAGAMTERDALAAVAPPSRQAALDTLSALRMQIATLPLASPEVGKPALKNASIWSRIAHAFSGIVHIRRDTGPTTPVVNAQFARELMALDLAQAQEALLAFDEDAYRDALQRVAATLAARFDSDDATVAAARAQIDALLAQRPTGPAPKLGGALAQLQSLHASEALRPTPPAPAGNNGEHRP